MLKYIHIRYWPVWCLIVSLRLISLLPDSWRWCIGSCLGRALKLLAKKRVSIADINMRLCFPEWSDEIRQKMIHDNFLSLGKSICDFSVGVWATDEHIRKLSRVEGVDNLEAALARGRGAILLAGHFTMLDITGRIMHLHTGFYPVYRRHNNALMEKFIGGARANLCGKAIQHDDLRAIYKTLRDKIPVYYIPDQNFGRKHSVFVPFFGVNTATITATSRLAAKYGTPVIPVTQYRDADNTYRVKFEKMLENFPTEDYVRDTSCLNQILEQQVRDNPVDYLWVHRRFKTRPEGEEPIY